MTRNHLFGGPVHTVDFATFCVFYQTYVVH